MPTANPFSYAKNALAGPAAATRSIMVLTCLRDNSATTDVQMIFGRVLGGFVTTEEWLSRAFRANNLPHGLAYNGIVSKALALGCSPALAKTFPQLRDLLRAMGGNDRAKTVWVENFGELAEAYEAKVRAFGPRSSRPGKTMAWLCAGEDDLRETVAQLREPVKLLPQTFDKFLNVASPAHKPPCPGRWTW